MSLNGGGLGTNVGDSWWGGGGVENQEWEGRKWLWQGSKYEALKMDIWNFQNSWIWIVITLACKFYGEFISGIFFSHEILDFMYF